jgi:hypothetical protein
MARSRDISKVLSSNTTLATDAEVAASYVAQSNSIFAGKNKIINGDFSIWQRGTSFTSDGYTADRWYMSEGGSTCTVSRQSFTPGQTDVPGNPLYFLRYNVSSYVAEFNLLHRVEDVNTFAGQTVTLSFYMKTSSSTTINLFMVQNFGSGGSSNVNTTLDTINVTTSWQRFSINISVPSISGKTVGTSSYLQIMPIRKTSSFTGDIDIAQVQLELGSSATTFVSAGGGSQQAELKLCERYYQKSYAQGINPGTAANYTGVVIWSSIITGAYSSAIPVFLKTTMRATPTITIYNPETGATGSIRGLSAANSFSGIPDYIGENNFAIYATTTQSPAGYLIGAHYVAVIEL